MGIEADLVHDLAHALIHEPTFKATVGQKIFIKAKLIKDLGNLAAHSHKPLLPLERGTPTRHWEVFGYRRNTDLVLPQQDIGDQPGNRMCDVGGA